MPAFATRFATLVVALFAVLHAGAALAAWPHDPLTNRLVNGDPTSQDGLAIAPDGAGGIYVAWADNRAGTLDAYVQHVLASGDLDPAWPAGGLVVCNEAGGQTGVAIVADGAGGAIVMWTDGRPFGLAGNYAQHVLATGVVDPAWPVNGRALCAGGGSGGSPKAVSDGAGGAIAVWFDSRGATLDIYAQRILATGVVDPAWPVNGRLLCGAAGAQLWPQVISDGLGGAIAAWEDLRTGTADIYARRVLSTGVADPAWPVDGRAVCTAVGAQVGVSLVSDGANGAWFGWSDARSGTDDVYVQRLNAAGAMLPGWFTDGLLICNAAGAQNGILLAPDGSGNAIATWIDARTGARDLYATRVLGYGAVHAGWPVNGLAVSTLAGSQYATTLVPDGAGGVFVAWYGADGASPDITAHHVRGTGSLDPAWPAAGVPVCTAPGNQFLPLGVADDQGGVIFAWTDYRSAGVSDLYAQRVARSGELGAPEPVITDLGDVPNDQGGRLRLAWDASWLDFEATPALVDQYRIYRSVPPNGAAPEPAEVVDLRQRDILAELASVTGYAWEHVATVNAENAWFLTSYGSVVQTLGDSTAAGNPTTAFLVVAFNAAGDRFWPSRPASGYSVDDLAPATPAPFTAAYESGATHLHWAANDEPDLAYYRLHRGDSPGFVPGPENLVASPSDTGHVDLGDAGGWYKLSAVDVHGNESPFAVLGPGGTTDVATPIASALALDSPWPNPARAETMTRFAIPRETFVRLTVHDLAGRLVRTLQDGRLAAGEHLATWNLRDDGNRPVANGLYFVRLEVEGRRVTERLAIAR